MDETLYQKLLTSAFRFVSYRPRSTSELKEHLRTKISLSRTGIATLEAVMARLAELGYADDRKFITWWIRARQSTNVRGMRVIRSELLAKGVDKEVLEEVIGQSKAYESTDSGGKNDFLSEKDSARIAIQKKLKAWAPLPAAQKKKKLSDFLARRGFPYDVIHHIVDEVAGLGVQ